MECDTGFLHAGVFSHSESILVPCEGDKAERSAFFLPRHNFSSSEVFFLDSDRRHRSEVLSESSESLFGDLTAEGPFPPNENVGARSKFSESRMDVFSVSEGYLGLTSPFIIFCFEEKVDRIDHN